MFPAMIIEIVGVIVVAASLFTAGWGLAILWQKDQPAYDPLPILPPPRAWELPAPIEPGGTYGLVAPIDLTLKNRHNDVAPIGSNELPDTYVKLTHNKQWRCQ